MHQESAAESAGLSASESHLKAPVKVSAGAAASLQLGRDSLLGPRDCWQHPFLAGRKTEDLGFLLAVI